MKTRILETLKTSYFSRNSRKERETFLFGMELEFPLVTIDGSNPDPSLLSIILTSLAHQYQWNPILIDRLGNYVKVIDPDGAVISYEACYGIIELSLPPKKSIQSMEKQFRALFCIIQNFLFKVGLQLIPTGLNPYPWAKLLPPLETPYIQMISGISKKYAPKSSAKIDYFHFITCSNQLHLDMQYENAANIINFFNAISWVKALLFANSFDMHEKNTRCLCMRDVYYRENSLGYNAHNVGNDEKWFSSTDDLLMCQMNKSIFYVIRSNEYIFFRPIPLKHFFLKNEVSGWTVLIGGVLKPRLFKPQLSDIVCFRPYNHAALTKRGTIEIRSECQQPLPDIMSSAAFHLGCMFNFEKAYEFVCNYKEMISNFNRLRNVAIYFGYEIQNILPFSVADFMNQLLQIAREGLIKRGLQEESYISVLFTRLEKQTNPAMELRRLVENSEDVVAYFHQQAQEQLGVGQLCGQLP